MNKKVILIIVGVGALLCVCAIVGVVLFGGAIFATTQPAVDVGDKFMQALKDENYDAAFATFHPALQQKVGNAQGLKRLIENGKAHPTKWGFSSRNVNNDSASLEGTVSMTGGEGVLSIELLKTADSWKITSFNLNAK